MSRPCFLCKEQSQETSGDTQRCLLCDRGYCDSHKGHFHGTCEINHSTYAHDHPDEPNVFPSLGERERALMTLQSPDTSSPEHPDRLTLATSPIVTNKAKRFGEPELAPPKINTTVVEEKDVVGADTPV